MTSINELFAARVLEFTRAEAILAALVVDIDNMKTSLTAKLTEHDNTLAGQLAQFRGAAVDEWLKGTNAGLSANYYDQSRHAAIGRARSLERRAYAAAEAAQALATLLEHTEPVITPDDLVTRIDAVAVGLYGDTYATDADAEADLTATWQALTPSPLVSPDAVEGLRRHYDTHITGPYTGQNLAALYAAVTDWRENHLSGGPWDAATWAYAVATLRSWDEAMSLWIALGDQRRGELGPADNVRLRTAIAARVKNTDHDQAPPPHELVNAVTEFDNAHMWLMTRIRSVETMAELQTVYAAINRRPKGTDGTLTVMRALARRFDALATTAPDADTDTGEGWGPANILSVKVANWRDYLYGEALSCTTGRGVTDYDEAARYALMDCALADARHTGNTEQFANLLDVIDRVPAGADHILTADHIGRLIAAATAHGDTAAIEINGGTHQ